MLMNGQLVEVLNKLINQICLEQIIDGDRKHIFRKRNIQRAVKIISKSDPIHKAKDIPDVNGIGNGIKRRVHEILTTGTLNELKSRDLTGLVELGKVHGIGPKKLADLYHQGIRCIADLDKVRDQLSTVTLVALKYHHSTTVRIPRELICRIERYLTDIIPSLFTICGSYRRGLLTSGDIDVLIMQSDGLSSIKPIVDELKNDGFLVAHLSSGHDKYNGICRFNDRYCRIDFLLTSEEQYYPALLHFTGSGLFNQIIRYNANKQGYKLSNLGLSRRDTGEIIPCYSEQDIFKTLGMSYLRPEQRDK